MALLLVCSLTLLTVIGVFIALVVRAVRDIRQLKSWGTLTLRFVVTVVAALVWYAVLAGIVFRLVYQVLITAHLIG